MAIVKRNCVVDFELISRQCLHGVRCKVQLILRPGIGITNPADKFAYLFPTGYQPSSSFLDSLVTAQRARSSNRPGYRHGDLPQCFCPIESIERSRANSCFDYHGACGHCCLEAIARERVVSSRRGAPREFADDCAGTDTALKKRGVTREIVIINATCGNRNGRSLHLQGCAVSDGINPECATGDDDPLVFG